MSYFKTLNISEVKRLLVEVLEKTIGLPPGRVLFESQLRPRPTDGLYCTVWWKESELLPQNYGDIFFSGESASCPDKTEPAIQRLRHESYCTVRISLWGPGAYEEALKLSHSLEAAERTFDFWRLLGYGGTGAVRDSSRTAAGQLQQSAFFNLSFYVCFGADYPAEWFDASQWAIDYAGQTEEFEYSEEIHNEPESGCLS